MSVVEPIVKMENISKNFGGVQALKNVDCVVYKKEVLGLLGDNGAGKSTLIKILVGIYPPDEGKIYFEGKEVRFSSPREARNKGIEVVFQDLALVDLMSIWRNFFLGRELTRKIGPFKLLDKKRADEICKNSLYELGIRIRSTDELVFHLSGGERQAISIERALYFGAKLLILDEPTAALSVKEARKVLEYVQSVRERGISVILISHNISHVYTVADRFTILSRGNKIGDFNKQDVTPEDIIDVISRS